MVNGGPKAVFVLKDENNIQEKFCTLLKKFIFYFHLLYFHPLNQTHPKEPFVQVVHMH